MTATNLTERDIAARTLLVLFNQGVTKRTPERFRDALRALNLTHGDLVRADQTMPYGWTPTGESTPTPASLAKRGKYKATAGTKMCGSDLCDEPVLPERANSRFCSDACRDDQDERDVELARTGRSGVTRRCTRQRWVAVVTAPKPTLGYSPLTGTTYVLLRNGQKRAVPEAELVAVIAGYLDDHHLSVTKPDGTVVGYGVLDHRAVTDALSTLDAIHRPDPWADQCLTCGPEGGRWPCASRGVADDLRDAVGEGGR